MFWFVKDIPNVANKKYLELGIYAGTNIDLLPIKVRHGVDILDLGRPTFKMTTDAFFDSKFGEEKYDIVYIDACHNYINVWRDFNNSVARLSETGIIMCHDMVPLTEQSANPGQCGDAYKFFAAVMDMESPMPFYTAMDSVNVEGFTVFTKPKELAYNFGKYATLSYTEFRHKLQSVRRYSVTEMQDLARSLII